MKSWLLEDSGTKLTSDNLEGKKNKRIACFVSHNSRRCFENNSILQLGFCCFSFSGGVFFDSKTQPSLHVTLIRTTLHSFIPVNNRIHFTFVKRLYRPNIVAHESRSTTILGLQFPKLAELERAETKKGVSLYAFLYFLFFTIEAGMRSTVNPNHQI